MSMVKGSVAVPSPVLSSDLKSAPLTSISVPSPAFCSEPNWAPLTSIVSFWPPLTREPKSACDEPLAWWTVMLGVVAVAGQRVALGVEGRR